jgi:hypothetical protein
MAPDDLKNWSKVILNDMACDEISCPTFVALVRTCKRVYAEACKVRAHQIKNRELDPEQPRGNSSQWLKRASVKAMDAIKHPEILGIGHSMVPGPLTGASNHWSAWQPSSRPSSSWDPHVLVESKGYGKGKSYGKDKRAYVVPIACHQGVSDKLKYLKQLLSKRFPNNKNYFAGLIYLGNDLNDFSVMDCAGFAVAPSDAHSKIIEIADIVYKERGGHGFIRAFIEDLLDIKKLSKEHIYELISYR